VVRRCFSRRALLALIASAGLSSCKPIDDYIDTLVGRIAKTQIEERTRIFKTQIAQLVASVTDANAQFEKLKEKVELDHIQNESSRDDYKSAVASLDSDCQTYGVARSSLGGVVVRCESVTPYLDGFKMRLLATVLAPIEVNGLTLTVSWIEDDKNILPKEADGEIRRSNPPSRISRAVTPQ
jgi:hypothetical protein